MSTRPNPLFSTRVFLYQLVLSVFGPFLFLALGGILIILGDLPNQIYELHKDLRNKKPA